MKKLLAALTLALLVSLALAVSAANATHSTGNGPNQDFVSGTGQFSPNQDLVRQIHVNATSGPEGEDPRGHIFQHETVFGTIERDLTADVTCLHVTGNRAVVGGEIERREGISDTPGGVFYIIEDNGEGNEAVDRFRMGFALLPPTDCGPLNFRPVTPLTEGNFVVHDAS